MKNTMKLLGIVALVAVIGFGMIACSNGSTDSGGGETTKFEGRWLSNNAIQQVPGLTDYSYTFIGDTWSFVSAGSNANQNLTYSGTFTFTDTTITFTATAGGSGTARTGYTLSGTTLTLTDNIGMGYGDFIKQ